VRPSDTGLAAELQAALDRHHDDIRAILRDYSVPLVDAAEGPPPVLVVSEPPTRKQ